MKKIFLLLFIFLILTSQVSAMPEISISLDGEIIESDVSPEIINQRTMVPLAIIGRTLGAEINWENETQKVEVIKDGKSASLFIKNPNLYFVEEFDAKVLSLESPPYIKNGRTMVPVRAISEIFGIDVNWDNDLRRVELKSPMGEVAKLDTLQGYYVASDASYEEINMPSFSDKTDNKNIDPPYYSYTNHDNEPQNIFNQNISTQNTDKITNEEIKDPFTKYEEVLGNINTNFRDIKVPIADRPTLKYLLQNAMMPMGRVLYIYGGAWNKADTGSGIEAKSLGLSPHWLDFFEMQDSSYNSDEHSYSIHSGLDCSGYIAWTLYNTFRKEDSKDYLVTSTKMAKNYADRGWGYYTPREEILLRRPGDIMSTKGHVWLSLGECEDGSVLLVHATPPGVKLSGTMTPDGKSDSMAHKLAVEYMKKYRPHFAEKFPKMYPNRVGYLREYDQFSWDFQTGVLTDPDGIQYMRPREVLKILFEE